jgi:3-phosphoinositide dependent protein kinase-1
VTGLVKTINHVLLQMLDPDRRLGSEDTGGFEALKAHPFFEGFDWEDLHKQQPPDLLPYLPPVGECKEPLWGNKTVSSKL